MMIIVIIIMIIIIIIIITITITFKNLSFIKLKSIVQQLHVKSTNKNTVFISKYKYLGRPETNKNIKLD